MPTSLFQLSKDTQSLLIEMLDQDNLNLNSSILNLRSTNKYLYNLVNFYWENKHTIKQIVTRGNSSYILLRNGELYGCGLNYNYGFTLKLKDPSSEKFIKINSSQSNSENLKFEKVFSSSETFIGLTKDGNLYGTGNTHHLGLNEAWRSKGKQLFSRSSYHSIVDDKVLSKRNFYANDTNGFEKIAPQIEKITDVAISNNHVLLLDDKGNVYACGDNAYAQLGTGDEQNLEQFTKVFDNAEKIFATNCNSFIVSQGIIYAIGKNFYKNITSPKKINTDLLYLPTPMLNVHNPGSIKKIFNYDPYNVLILVYDNGDVYYIGKNQSKILLATNVVNVYSVYFSGQSEGGLLTLRKDGSLYYNGGYWDKLLSQYSKYLLNFKENFEGIIVGLCEFIPTKLSKKITPVINYYCSTLITDQVTDVSNTSSRICDPNFEPSYVIPKLSQTLFFSRNNGKRLYVSGLNCFKGELGLGFSINETNGPYNEVEVNLPLKTKLLRGKALTI